MNSLPEKIEVMCPRCGEIFEGWCGPSIDPATSSDCPNCGFELAYDPDIYQDGFLEPAADGRELA